MMETGHPRRRGISPLWIILLSVVLAGMAALIAFFPREPALLAHATQIARTETWTQGYGGYFWQSDKSVLAFQPSGAGVLAVNVSAETGSETPFSGLTAGLVHGVSGDLSRWRLSPDGKVLIWEDAWQPDDLAVNWRPRWIACTLEGAKRKTWTASSNGSFAPLWFLDNKRWVEARRADNGQGVVPIIHSLDGKDVPCAPIQGPFTWPLAVTPEERLLTLEWRQVEGHITWYEYPLRSKSVPPVITSVPLPKGATSLIEAELSPQGDRIACLVSYEHASPLDRLLFRFVPNYSPRPQQRTALWIFRRDGKGSRLIGSENGTLASGLLWAPDGKRVSLYDHAALFVIPVE